MSETFLVGLLGFQPEPVLVKVYRWKLALPQYTVGHLERVTKLKETIGSVNGLFVTGSAFRGVGLPDCIHEGALTAEQVVRLLADKKAR